MLTELEAVLETSADAGWTLDEGAHGVLLTASTRQAFSNTSDAVTAAQELLAQVQDVGYRLLGGSVGAEMPVDGDGACCWSGTLDVLLAEELDPPAGRRLRSV